MKITCESCGAKYTIADKKVQGRRVKIRCKSCSKQIVVDAKPDGTEDVEAPARAEEAALGDDQVTQEAPAVATTWEVNLSDTDQRSMTQAEILAGWESGVVTQNAFVWKDGLADWMPIGQVPELNPGPKEAAEAKPASPSLPPAPPARVFGDKPKVHKAAAKLPGTGARSDLFGRAAAAGSEEEARNQLAAGSTPYVEQNPTGARNENSVLFSIDALKAGFSKTPARTEPAPKTSEDDPFGMSLATGGVMGGLSLGGNDALLSQPAPEPPKPVPVVAAAVPGAAVAPADDKRKLVAILGAAVAVLLAIIVVMAVGGKDETKVAAADSSATAGSEKAPANADAKPAEAEGEKKPEGNADSAKPPEAAAKDGAVASATPADKTGGDSNKTGTAKPAGGSTPGGTPAGGKPPAGKGDDSTKVKDNPSSGVASFNKSAAKTALSSAANSASGCARPDGPVGNGQVIVTFAPSGRVTSANVGGAFGGTRVGSCVASIFRRAAVPPFSGAAVTVSKSFSISR